jgi:hypothetical protein
VRYIERRVVDVTEKQLFGSSSFSFLRCDKKGKSIALLQAKAAPSTSLSGNKESLTSLYSPSQERQENKRYHRRGRRRILESLLFI